MGKTVMVVDDHKDIRNAFKKTLELEGYRVITASSGIECLNKLKKEKPDLILLDILMPKMSGITTLEKIRGLYPALKIIIITVVSEETTKEKTVNIGIDGYIIKPVTRQDLKVAVANVLSEV